MQEEVYTGNEQDSTRDEREIMRDHLIGYQAQGALRFQAAAIREFGPAAGVFARQLLFWDGKGIDPNGWIYKSIEQWRDETGLSRRQQEAARKRLQGSGKGQGEPVLEEKHDVGPDGRWRLFYRLDLKALMDRIGEDLCGPGQVKPSTSAQGCSLNRTGTMPTLVSRDYARLSTQTKQESTQEKTQKNPPGGARAPHQESQNQKTGNKTNPEKTSTFSDDSGNQRHRLARELAEGLSSDLEAQGAFLDDDRHEKYRANFKRLVDKGVEAGELQKVAARIVERWPDYQLSPQQALGDVRGEITGDTQPSPPEVVEAIKVHSEFGVEGKQKRSKLWEVAEAWDFTSDQEPPRKVRDRISPDRKEAQDWILRLRKLAGKAMNEARYAKMPELRPEGDPESYEAATRIDSPAPEEVPEGSTLSQDSEAPENGVEFVEIAGTYHATSSKTASRVGRLLQDPETNAGRVMARHLEGKLSEEDVIRALSYEIWNEPEPVENASEISEVIAGVRTRIGASEVAV